jgi:hypothetical protein
MCAHRPPGSIRQTQMSSAGGAKRSGRMNRVAYSGGKMYYICIINFKKYTSTSLSGYIRTDETDFVFEIGEKIKSEFKCALSKQELLPVSSLNSVQDTTLCLSWHSIQSPSCSRVLIRIFNQTKATIFLVFITRLCSFYTLLSSNSH